MNRKRIRAGTKNNEKTNVFYPRQARELIENSSVSLLIMGINHTLEILEKRGIVPCDFDKRGRKLYRLKIIQGQVCFLAAADMETNTTK